MWYCVIVSLRALYVFSFCVGSVLRVLELSSALGRRCAVLRLRWWAWRCAVLGMGELMRLQVPMVGKGVVESMLQVLGAVQGGSAEALAVQEAACITLQNLAAAADNWVRGLVAGRFALSGLGCGLGWAPGAMHRCCGCCGCVVCMRVRGASRCDRSMRARCVACFMIGMSDMRGSRF
jgi:hypothetical protein